MTCIPNWFHLWMLLPVGVAGLIFGVFLVARFGFGIALGITVALSILILILLAQNPDALQYCNTIGRLAQPGRASP